MYLLKILAIFALSRSTPCVSTASNRDSLSGIISSQDGDSQYGSDNSCIWQITSRKTDDIIKFTVLSFDTECGFDYLTIYDGITPLNTNTIAKLCGKRNIGLGNSMVYVSNGNSAALEFKTDSNVERSGFRIQYDILSRTKICTSRTGCSDRGSCINNVCSCDLGFSGLACQSNANSPQFTPRQRHSITFVENLDLALVTFGRNFYTSLEDMVIYNFSTSTWSVPDNSKWGDAPLKRPQPRFDHTTFWFNSKLYMYGGQDTRLNIFGDLWEYDLTLNIWSRIQDITGSVPYLFEPTVVIVPSDTTFQIYVTGGISRSEKVNINLYCFDYTLKKWIDLGYAPVAYQGGSGVYHNETNSINFALSGYPNYDAAYNSGQLYSWKYSIDTQIWSPMGLRSPAEILYLGKSIYDSSSEIALVHGGLALNSADQCFVSSLWQLDLACKTWALLPSVKVPRVGQGIVKRGSSLWVFGGYEGVLEGDVKEIPLTTELESQSTRDQCRASNYCSFITECDACSKQAGCLWCNDACAYDDKKRPLSTAINQTDINFAQGYLPNGVCGDLNATTTCPPRIILQASTPYTFDIKYQTFKDFYYYWDTTGGVQIVAQIDGIEPPSTRLRLTFIDQLPFPVSTLSSKTSIQILFPQKQYTRIRVSWDNSFGIPSPIPLDKDVNGTLSKDQDLKAYFTIQVTSSLLQTEYPLELLDYLIIFFLALAVVLGLTGVAQWIRSYRTSRRNHYVPRLAAPIPELHAFRFVNLGLDPMSLERIRTEGKTVLARTFLVIMPRGGNELPTMSTGTFMRLQEEDNGVKGGHESQEGILMKIRQSKPFE